MSEPSLALLLLGVMAFCAVVATAVLVAAVSDLRQVLRKINGMLPRADEALEEGRRTAREVRHLLSRANRISRDVETVAHSVCEGALAALEHMSHLKQRAQRLFTGPWHNGARGGPRSQ